MDMTPMSTSLWAHTATAAPRTLALDGNDEVGTVVVGGGFAGLSTALHLAERGESVHVLEAGEIGQGASGRNGGQVIPGIKYDPQKLRKMFGPEVGVRAVANFGSTAAKVFELIDRYQIDCDDTRVGWIQPAHTKAGLSEAYERCRQWAEEGADVAPLSREEVVERLGAQGYHGGWIDRRAGSVQPLSYVRGLAAAVLSQGGAISTGTEVTRVEPEGAGWRTVTEGGHVLRSRKVVLCGNAYTGGLIPRIARSYIAANSFQVATAPLAPGQAEEVMPGGIVASDTRRLLAYFRRDRENRILMGGRGSFKNPVSDQGFAHLVRMLHKTFPQLAGQPIEFRWAGRVTITQDFLPHFHEPQQGLISLVGCQGRGVALQSRMGEWLADYVATGDRNALPLPVTPVRTIPLHELRELYVAATVAYYKLRDLI